MLRTHLVLVVDRSGSMNSIRDDAQGAINSFIEDQRKNPDGLTISLYDFDSAGTERVFGPVEIEKAEQYTLNPRGSTPLLDAMGTSIKETDDYLKSLDGSLDQPKHTLFVVVTDGGENCSREFTKEKISSLIRDREDHYGWKFLYLSSDFNAFDDANKYGFAGQNTMSFGTSGVSYRSAVTASSLYTTNLREFGSADLSVAVAAVGDEELKVAESS